MEAKQLLQNRDVLLTDETPDVWYDLSQGVMDIVVKLFVLAQLRISVTKRTDYSWVAASLQGRTKNLYIHAGSAALWYSRKIIQYSDLMIPEMDKRLIQLQQDIAAMKEQSTEEVALQQLATDDERRIYLMLKDDYDSTLLVTHSVKHLPKIPNLLGHNFYP